MEFPSYKLSCYNGIAISISLSLWADFNWNTKFSQPKTFERLNGNFFS